MAICNFFIMNRGEVNDQEESSEVNPDKSTDVNPDKSTDAEIEDFTKEVYKDLALELDIEPAHLSIDRKEIDTYEKKDTLDKIVYDRLKNMHK